MHSRRHTCDKVDDTWIDHAPVRLVTSTAVAATPAEIWGALEDESAWPRWTGVITNVEWTSPRPFGAGTTRTVTMRGGLLAEEEFVAWEPHRRLAFRFVAASTKGVRAFAERYTLDPVADGRTRVTWVMAMAPAGFSKIVVPVIGPAMRRAFARMLRRFGELVEREYARPRA